MKGIYTISFYTKRKRRSYSFKSFNLNLARARVFFIRFIVNIFITTHFWQLEQKQYATSYMKPLETRASECCKMSISESTRVPIVVPNNSTLPENTKFFACYEEKNKPVFKRNSKAYIVKKVPLKNEFYLEEYKNNEPRFTFGTYNECGGEGLVIESETTNLLKK